MARVFRYTDESHLHLPSPRTDANAPEPRPTEVVTPAKLTGTVVRSVAEARGYLAARNDARPDLTDDDLPWYLRNKYGVVCDANAPAPVAPPAPSRVDPPAPEPSPAQTRDRFGERVLTPGESTELNPTTGEPLTSYERYAREYYRQNRATSTTRVARDSSDGVSPNARQAAFARLAEVHADQTQDHVDRSARPNPREAQQPGPIATRHAKGFDAYRRAFDASWSGK